MNLRKDSTRTEDTSKILKSLFSSHGTLELCEEMSVQSVKVQSKHSYYGG